MVLIKNATLLKTSVDFGEGEAEALDWISPDPNLSLKGAIHCFWQGAKSVLLLHVAIFSIIFHSSLRLLPRVTIKVRFFIDELPWMVWTPSGIVLNFVDGKPHISSKHDHNKKNFWRFRPFSKHAHPLPSIPQIKAMKAEASRRGVVLWQAGVGECRSLGLEKDGLTLWNKNWMNKK